MPTVPTASPGTNTTQAASTAFVLANAGGTPGGSDTYVQFNDSSALGGKNTFTFVKGTDTFGLTGTFALADIGGHSAEALAFSNTSLALHAPQMFISPTSGTNVATFLSVAPRGNGLGAGSNQTRLVLYNSDFLADSANYELLAIGANGTAGYTIWTGATGTATNRQLSLSSGAARDGTTNVNQLVLATNGHVGVGTASPSSTLEVAGMLTAPCHVSATHVDTDASTVTFDLSVSDWHRVVLGGNRTLAVSNATVDQQFTIVLKQDGTGSRTISSWFSGILWAGGSAPTLTTTPDKRDIFTFKVESGGVYLGMVAAQNV